ncbi:Lrp/AsnC family transcriptional regulator [Aestuariibius sp. 2305UL40-4]|uniref:Lrp/AsnC family transcriptional regulator n=1 Tax=Aestuariibius violaceus TaxID=3234132 RepID=UPI00345E3B38
MPNDKNTDTIRQNAGPARPIDPTDRRILAALTTRADLSYAELGQEVGLSAPAVHERVKRLKASGVIEATVARIDGAAIGKPLLAFIHVNTVGWGKTPELMALCDLPEVEEMHSVTGDACVLIKARLADSAALEGFLARLYDLPGVSSTQTYVALSSFTERVPQAGITESLSAPLPIRRR